MTEFVFESIQTGLVLAAFVFVWREACSAEKAWRETKRLKETLREHEEQLRRARREALAANEAKTTFLANINHELRTPLGGILGMSQMLADTDLTAEQRDYVETIHRSGETLLTTIGGILDFSDIESGTVALETVDFDLRAELETPCDAMALKAREKGLGFNRHIESDVPTALRGDPIRLRQIVDQLLENAIKFTHRGEVWLRVSRVSEDTERATLRLSVADTGVAIPKEKLDSLGDAFTQADASTTRRFGGTGLGLAICRRLVGLMGGRLGIQSEEASGSTVWFTAVFQKQHAGEPHDVDALIALENELSLLKSELGELLKPSEAARSAVNNR